MFYFSTFTDKSCESLHTQKHRQLFFQPEKDFWMIMVIQESMVYSINNSNTDDLLSAHFKQALYFTL